jgi:hypothetical protein
MVMKPNVSRLAVAAAKPVHRRSKRATRPQLLMRSQLDGRTNAAKYFDKLADDIATDLGGRDQLTAIQRSLIEGFCGACVVLAHLNTKLALGEPIDISQHSQTVGAMVRVATRLGCERIARNVTPTLSDYLRTKHEAGA